MVRSMAEVCPVQVVKAGVVAAAAGLCALPRPTVRTLLMCILTLAILVQPAFAAATAGKCRCAGCGTEDEKPADCCSPTPLPQPSCCGTSGQCGESPGCENDADGASDGCRGLCLCHPAIPEPVVPPQADRLAPREIAATMLLAHVETCDPADVASFASYWDASAPPGLDRQSLLCVWRL